jgi:hypothetical protein
MQLKINIVKRSATNSHFEIRAATTVHPQSARVKSPCPPVNAVSFAALPDDAWGNARPPGNSCAGHHPRRSKYFQSLGELALREVQHALGKPAKVPSQPVAGRKPQRLQSMFSFQSPQQELARAGIRPEQTAHVQEKKI